MAVIGTGGFLNLKNTREVSIILLAHECPRVLHIMQTNNGRENGYTNTMYDPAVRDTYTPKLVSYVLHQTVRFPFMVQNRDIPAGGCRKSEKLKIIPFQHIVLLVGGLQ